MTTTDPSAGTGLPDLFDPRTIDNPYAAYAELRSLGPVYDGANGCWLLARHDDVMTALHQPTLLSSEGGFRSLMSGAVGPESRRGRGSAIGLDSALGSRVLIASDPPVHTSLRRLVSRPFTKGAMESWLPRIAELSRELVDTFLQRAAGDDGDFVQDLAIPLPVMVIAEILDIPASRRADFRRWSDALVGTLGADADLQTAREDVQEMFAFFFDVAQSRRRDPGDDLISAIAAPGPDGETLDPLEVVMFCVLLLVAGNETTTNLLGNLVEALWDHPSELEALRTEPALVPEAVEEALRFCGPVQGLLRRTTGSTALGGVEIPPESDVLLLFASANRDDAVFDDADTYRIRRDTRDQIAFGHGIHYCLGAHLARIETIEVLKAMLVRGVDLEPAGAPKRTGSAILRGFTNLPVRAVA